MATKRMKVYKVVIERDVDAWLARVPAVPGCHTYGRTLEAARRRIREALALWIPDVRQVTMEFDVRLPRRVAERVRPFRSARARVEGANAEAQRELRRAARALVSSGLSLRDAADVLGLSHQRVSQVL